MSDPMEQSLEGYSEFIALDNNSNMEQSLCGVSQKIPIPNASMVNREEQMKDKKAYEQLMQEQKIAQQIEGQDMDESTNEFLNVGKWNKPKSQVTIAENKSEKMAKNQEIKTQKQIKNQSKVSKKKSENKSKVSKWNKSKNQTPSQIKDNHSNAHHVQNNNSFQIHKSTKPLTVPQEPHWHQHQPHPEPKQQQEEEEDEDEDEEEEEEDEQEEDEQEEDEEQDEQDQQDQQDQQDDEGEEQQQEIEEQPQEEEQQEQDKFKAGLADDKSSQAFQTQIANTSALGKTPVPSKWAKKKPLETMTKYQTNAHEKQTKFHSRLNSATYHQEQQEQILENDQDNTEGGTEQWGRVEKVLMRLKLILG